MIKSADAINAEIKALQEMKPNVRQHSAFGDDNHEAIEAQLQVMREGMNIGDIEHIWGDDTAEEFDQNVYDAALVAHDWMYGLLADEDDAAPSEDWQSLIEHHA